MVYRKEWKTVELQDLGEVVGGGTPSTKKDEYYGGLIPWITPKDLSNYNNKYICRGERSITQKGLNNSSAKLLPKGTVLFSSRAPIGYIAIAANEICTNQGFKSIIPNERTTSDFLYYLLKYNTENIKNNGSGSTFNEVSGRVMKKIKVTIPEKRTQIRISSILSSLDQKIEVNNKIIANLEEQAQAIFNSWFVDFEPFQAGEFIESELGLIPEGWKVINLLKLVDFLGGSQPPKSEHIYEKKPGYIRFVQNRDYALNDDHLTYIRISNRNKICTEDDILMDKYGEAGKTRFGIAGAYNVALAKIDPFDVNDKEYIRRFLEQKQIKDYIYNSSMASTRPSVNKNTLSSIKVIYPRTNLLSEFSNFSKLVVQKTLHLREENQKLAETRDALLPKLMSGEIDVSGIKIDNGYESYE